MQMFYFLSPFFTLFVPEVAVIASDKNKMGYVPKQDTQRGWNARLTLS